MRTYTLILIFLFCTTISKSQTCFSSVSCGANHFSAQKTDGSLIACGRGGFGALANGTGVDEYTPISLATGTNWLFLHSGYLNTYAIRSDNTLWGCGNNQYGALGVGNFTGGILDWTQIGTANNWAKVSGADFSTIGLKTNGTLWGWGQNVYYQMGNGTSTFQELTPIQIHPDTDWVDIETSQFGVGFAIKSNGTLWGWGSNCSAILVGGSDVPNRPTVTQLLPDTNWKILSVGGCHVLALKTDNTLWAWGGNESGQLGTNNPGNASTNPVQVGTDTWKSIATGSNTSFGIKTNGTLWAWGLNDVGQLGLGTTTNQTIPVQVGTATNWESVSCGGFDFAVALKTDGSLYTWGQNDFGQLGNGTTNPQLVPTLVISCPLNTESFTNKKVTLYPNPVKDIVSLNLLNETPKQIEIYNTLGQIVLSVNYKANQIDVNQLKTGTYFMKVNFDDTTEIVKFVKE